MAAIYLSDFRVLKSVVRRVLPDTESSRLGEALARAAGFKTHAALLASAESNDGRQPPVAAR